MFIIFLVLITILLAVTAAYFSVVGLAALFSFHYWGSIIMGASLEAGKLVTTSYLYKYWKDINFVRRYLMASIVILLMGLTSIGIFGYLMQGFQEGTSGKEVSNIKLEANNVELNRVQSRLKDIETQISNLPSNSVKGRIQLEKTYRKEAEDLRVRLFELTKEQASIKTTSLEADSHLGPIVYVAKEFGVDTAKAATYLVLLIVVIFDPLTVLLTLSINHVLQERDERKQKAAPAPSAGAPPTRGGLDGDRRGAVEQDTPSTDTLVTEENLETSREIESQENEEKPELVEENSKPTVTPVPPHSGPIVQQKKIIAATNSGQLIYED